VLLELLPLGLGGLAIFLAGAQRPPTGDEPPVVAKHVLGIEGGVRLGRGQRFVPEQLGHDVDR
jgi:hypothetical protein